MSLFHHAGNFIRHHPHDEIRAGHATHAASAQERQAAKHLLLSNVRTDTEHFPNAFSEFIVVCHKESQT